MIEVKLSTISPEWPWTRQTPGSRGVWQGCQFYADQDIKECDYWVVYEGIHETQKTLCPSENTILITAEPSTTHYPQKFMKQFNTVVTFHRKLKHPNIIYSQPGLPWHVGRKVRNDKNISFSKNYEELKEIKDFKKNKLISVVVSNKTFYPGHIKRLKFVKKLAEQNLFEVDIFGRGIRDIEDKWDAIAGYKYHIALENSTQPDYFTEKLTDAFLGSAYPFYYGCPNILDYFPKDALTPIDVDDFEKTIEIIHKTMNDDRYEKSIEKIQIARDLVLDKYNVFALITDIIKRTSSHNKKRELVTIVPASKYQSINMRAIAKMKTEIARLRARL